MARWLHFYGPRKKRGSVEDVVSHQPQVKQALAFHANLIYARAQANLEFMPKTRTHDSYVGMDGPAQGRWLDYIIYLQANDHELTPDQAKKASAAIEIHHGILAEAVGRAIRRGTGA